MLAEIVGADQVSPDSHFFDDLGADSMSMTRFCARVRKRPDLPAVSMRDVYRNPTAAMLAAALAPPDAPTPSAVIQRPAAEMEPPRPTSTTRYVLCGAGQALFIVGYGYLVTVALARGTAWIAKPAGPLDIWLRAALDGSRLGAGYVWLVGSGDVAHLYLRAVTFGTVAFVALCALPVIAKWVLIGRWRPDEFPVWSLRYFRFWVVKTLVRTSPLALFAGTPLYLVYLRSLGARIGPGATIISGPVPVCTDLITIGAGSVVCKDVIISGYRANSGRIEVGPVTLGERVYIGATSVLDIDTEIDDGGRLGHASSLHPGQVIPAGEVWHGTPGRPADESFPPVPEMPCGVARKIGYTMLQLLTGLAGAGPLTLAAAVVLFTRVPAMTNLLSPTMNITTWALYRTLFGFSTVLFFGLVVAAWLVVRVVPRLIALLVKPDTAYPLYGLRYWALRSVGRATNIRFFHHLCGDTWLIPHYLNWIGYRQPDLVQTGTNFGMGLKHDSPYLNTVGSGTVIADGLSLVNADYSATSFRISPVSIGARNFLGNNIAYPAGGRTGDNCLLATKVMVPVTGPVREGVGLLGSPAFEIPRTVLRDTGLVVSDPDELSRLLKLKARHNADSMALMTMSGWVLAVGLTVIVGWVVQLYTRLGPGVVALAGTLSLVLTVAGLLLVDLATRHLVALVPDGCSIYDHRFWRHERFWKLSSGAHLRIFDGTPFKPMLWRLHGAKVGRRVFDDGCYMAERTLVTIGDECTLNAESIIQCHSQEDGAFKSDYTEIGSHCTLGVGAFVHYGVRMEDRSVLDADAFLMKGEQVMADTRWTGNPASESRCVPSAEAPPKPSTMIVWPRSMSPQLGSPAALPTPGPATGPTPRPNPSPRPRSKAAPAAPPMPVAAPTPVVPKAAPAAPPTPVVPVAPVPMPVAAPTPVVPVAPVPKPVRASVPAPTLVPIAGSTPGGAPPVAWNGNGTGTGGAAGSEFWRSVLAAGGFSPIPRWSTEPAADGRDTARHELMLPTLLIAALTELAGETGVPLSSVLLGAHIAVLTALTGERDVTTGFVPEPGGRALPLRPGAAAVSWRGLLAETHQAAGRVTEHRDDPLDELRAELGSTGPLFETVFDPKPRRANEPLPADVVLRVQACLDKGTPRLRLTYRRDVLDAEAAARIGDYHLTALRLMIADPDARYVGQSLLSVEELRFQLDGLAGPVRELPDRRLHELFERRVTSHPDAVAVVQGEREWTYRELNARANQIGRALLSRGLRPEGVVAVVTERDLDWAAAVIGIFKAGGVYLPVEPRFPAERIATTLARAGCRFVLTEPGSSDNVNAALEGLDGVTRLLIEGLYAEGLPETDLGVQVGAGQLAYIFFTSGSTGQPKGAMCEHAGMLNHLYAKIIDLRVGSLPETGADWDARLEPAPDVVVAQTAPQCFDISLWQLVSALLVGGRTVLVEQEVVLDVARFVGRIERAGVSVLQVVPSYLEAVVSYLEHDRRELAALSCVAVTGEALKKELVARWFALRPGRLLVNAYGLTETSDDTNHEVMARAPDTDRVPLGPAVINVRVYVVDEDLRPVPLGAVGEIVYSGVCVGRGYVNDPDRTAAVFLADPYRPGTRLYRGGDFGRWLPEGKLEFLGRRDSQVKVAGFRIELGEIENKLLAVPGVRDGAVVAVGGADRRRLVAFYTGAVRPVAELRTTLGAALPEYMLPATFAWRAELPLTGNGKVDRTALTELAAQLEAPAGRVDTGDGPRGATEQRLAAAWAEVLDIPVDQIGRSDNFFDRGGTSLAAVKLAVALDRAVSPKDLTRHPVLAELAELIEGGPR